MTMRTNGSSWCCRKARGVPEHPNVQFRARTCCCPPQHQLWIRNTTVVRSQLAMLLMCNHHPENICSHGTLVAACARVCTAATQPAGSNMQQAEQSASETSSAKNGSEEQGAEGQDKEDADSDVLKADEDSIAAQTQRMLRSESPGRLQAQCAFTGPWQPATCSTVQDPAWSTPHQSNACLLHEQESATAGVAIAPCGHMFRLLIGELLVGDCCCCREEWCPRSRLPAPSGSPEQHCGQAGSATSGVGSQVSNCGCLQQRNMVFHADRRVCGADRLVPAVTLPITTL